MLLKEALGIDSIFAKAYLLLSMRYSFLSSSSKDHKEYDRLIDSSKIACEQAIRLDPEDPETYEQMSSVLLNSNKPEESLQFALRANDNNPYSSVNMIVYLYKRKGDFHSAAKFIDQSIKIDPTIISNYLIKSGLFSELGLMDSSKNYIDRASALEPLSPEPENELWHYYRITRQVKSALKLEARLYGNLKVESHNAASGTVYFFNRDWRRADSLFTRSTVRRDIDAGLTAIRMGRKAEGEKLLKESIERRLAFLGATAGYNDIWPNYDVFRAYAALGDDKQYPLYIKRAIDLGWHYMGFFVADPFLDDIRHTSEFKKIEKIIIDRNEKYKREALAVFSKKH